MLVYNLYIIASFRCLGSEILFLLYLYIYNEIACINFEKREKKIAVSDLFY